MMQDRIFPVESLRESETPAPVPGAWLRRQSRSLRSSRELLKVLFAEPPVTFASGKPDQHNCINKIWQPERVSVILRLSELLFIYQVLTSLVFFVH